MTHLNFTQPTAHRLMNEAEAALIRKDFVTAFKHFKNILEHYPEEFEHDQLLLKCAMAASSTGDRASAIKYLKQSFKLKPTQQKLEYLKELQQENGHPPQRSTTIRIVS
jgi:outer membrane protein assembly factor BamD (BamD/ComL family)